MERRLQGLPTASPGKRIPNEKGGEGKENLEKKNERAFAENKDHQVP